VTVEKPSRAALLTHGKTGHPMREELHPRALPVYPASQLKTATTVATW
jgi:hypothetical protein